MVRRRLNMWWRADSCSGRLGGPGLGGWGEHIADKTCQKCPLMLASAKTFSVWYRLTHTHLYLTTLGLETSPKCLTSSQWTGPSSPRQSAWDAGFKCFHVCGVPGVFLHLSVSRWGWRTPAVGRQKGPKSRMVTSVWLYSCVGVCGGEWRAHAWRRLRPVSTHVTSYDCLNL